MKISLKKSNKFRLVIFSKDRAMQLEALFSSIAKNARDVFSDINVLFTTSDESYKYSYEILEENYSQVNFIEEKDFNNDIHNLIDDGSYNYIMFLTDDDIIFKDISAYGFKRFITEGICCFSYRLGTNINYCYSCDKPNKLGIHSCHGNIISWDWRDEELDFNYPLSVTSHVFYSKLIKKVTKDLYFTNPNNMEAKIQERRNILPLGMMSPEYSCIVGIPANKVNTEYPNRNGLKYPYSTEELNNLFLNNKKIDISKMDFSNINAAQQEIKYEFTD